MESFLFIAGTVFPVFILIVLGYYLYKRKVINKEFSTAASRLVFTMALPCLVFKEISGAPLEKMVSIPFVVFMYTATILSAVLAWIIGRQMKLHTYMQGAFVQGSFRGNFAIIGLALLSNAGSQALMTKGAVALAFILPFYNVLSIIVLTIPQKTEKGLSYTNVLKEIFTNPLIIALLSGLIFSLLHITVPGILIKSVGYLASMAMPLALLGIGASLASSNISHLPTQAFIASLLKVIVFPVLLTYGAYAVGYRGDDLFILCILFSSPSAIVSYIMAEAMGSDGYLAGAVILISTLMSVGTISLGLIILKSYALI